jgi:DNA-binding NarL/FixJ family response regulator
MQPPPKLTPREQEILPFLTSGANRNEIASHFGLSAETVKRHTRNILAKFGAKTLRDGMWDITDYLNNYGLPDPLYPLFAIR